MTGPTVSLTVDELAGRALDLLAEADERFPETTGNSGRTPATLAARANILATLAVAVGIRGQQAQSEAAAAAATAAREALTIISARVQALAENVTRLQAAIENGTGQLGAVREAQRLLEQAVADLRTQLSATTPAPTPSVPVDDQPITTPEVTL